ncbi:hypothetical protein DM01DRAFT_251984 [Hesseltinella vesiculosa]|uniref:Resolvase/invertase-type recombinase catalytic domain-containing protein n=1 Tax=Hesseltinella vesiculosa TaxID=101127 RepID=A0A1X2G5D1_9FUNG|nr:hypothetical protein DM01DRAFT_251984 [Hesseltinella vesiculosa]
MTIIGYVRKSPGKESTDARASCLQNMVDKLRQRSFASKVFISPVSVSNEPLAERDQPRNQKLLKQLKGIDGTTQDMLQFLNETDQEVCLVCIDYAGLTTNVEDLTKFLR